ncbi:hypothetical protein GCM10009566_37640 [Streptomyces murinus]
MSSEREYESEAPGAPGAGAASPLSSFPPPVYHPRPGPAPAYEEYADPAAAHGWQNAYDETRELPPITEFGPQGPVGTEGFEGPGGAGAPRDPGGAAASRVSGVGVPIGYGPSGPGAPGIGVEGGPAPALGDGRAERRRREQRRRGGRRLSAAAPPSGRRGPGGARHPPAPRAPRGGAGPPGAPRPHRPVGRRPAPALTSYGGRPAAGEMAGAVGRPPCPPS